MAWRQSHRPITFNITPYGVLARVPMVKFGELGFCFLGWFKDGRELLLCMRRCPHQLMDTDTPSYQVIETFAGESFLGYPRARLLAANLDEMACDMGWETVYIDSSSSSRFTYQYPSLYIPANHSYSPPIRIPERILTKSAIGPAFSITHGELPWTGHPPTILISDRFAIGLQYGKCTSSAEQAGHRDVADTLWANIRSLRHGTSVGILGDHNCDKDHIVDWPRLRRTWTNIDFGGPNRRLRLDVQLAFHISHSLESTTLTLTQLDVRMHTWRNKIPSLFKTLRTTDTESHHHGALRWRLDQTRSPVAVGLG